MHNIEDTRIAVIGLGYVGLPLALAFAARHPVVGFDIDDARITALKSGVDVTRETDEDTLRAAKNLRFTTKVEELAACNVYIVTVPTPVDAMKRPNLDPLLSASRAVGQIITKGDTVIFESTVYPGATEEDCVPVIEEISGLTFNRDFFAGYSPERVNPGDKTHRLADIVKITSGSTPEAADFIDALYSDIITAGTHRAPSIRVAEAAKVIENTQRDVNIALVNELAVIFERMNLDTLDVLEAAGTKWNFLPFRPGLVGGHCIGVDPYYLTHKSQNLGYDPQIVLAGRRINDAMGPWIAQTLIRHMIARDMRIKGARVLILGLTFKEDVPDLRNTRVVDVVHSLEEYGLLVNISDPLADAAEANAVLGVQLSDPAPDSYDVVILAVPHATLKAQGRGLIDALLKSGGLVVDIKGVLPRGDDVLRI